MGKIWLPDIPLVSNIWLWYGLISVAIVLLTLFVEFEFGAGIEKLLKQYGTISYSTYLYHNLFISMAVLILIHYKIYDSALRVGFVFVFTIFTTYITSAYSFTFVEKKFIGIGRRITASTKKLA